MNLYNTPDNNVIDTDGIREYLQDYMEYNEISNSEAAEMANVSRTSFTKFFNGTVINPSFEWLVRVFKALHIPVEQLLEFVI